MFGLFAAKNSAVDVVTRAKVRATREKNEEVAVRQFLESICADATVMTELLETRLKTVEYLFGKVGIKNETERHVINGKMEILWEQMLNTAVREYVRDCRKESAKTGGDETRGLVIEFATF